MTCWLIKVFFEDEEGAYSCMIPEKERQILLSVWVVPTKMQGIQRHQYSRRTKINIASAQASLHRLMDFTRDHVKHFLCGHLEIHKKQNLF